MIDSEIVMKVKVEIKTEILNLQAIKATEVIMYLLQKGPIS